jgi:hypothetical protein
VPRKKKQKAIDALFQEQSDYEVQKLRAELKAEKQQKKSLSDALEKAKGLWSSSYIPVAVSKKRRRNTGTYLTRVAAGDLHGVDQDVEARNAFLRDLEILNPDEVVYLGDMINCSGTFSRFHRVHVSEYSYNYENDVAAGNDFLDLSKKAASNATFYYLKGNHEARVDKWAAAAFSEKYLAQMAIDTFGVRNALHLDKRGVHFFDNNECHMGLHKPGIIILGKCGFLHGYAGGKHVSAKHLGDLGINLVHGHNHRAQSHTIRTAKDSALQASCPGCLCILQQYYNHERPTDHTHGYALQFEDKKSRWFNSINIPIVNGKSLLHFVNIK